MKKKLLTVLLAVVMVFGVFGLTACSGSNADEDYNYYALKYEIEDEVKIEAVTFQGIYKMFTTKGNFIVYVATEGNGGASASDFQKVNKLAADWGITIYHFNPELSGGYAAKNTNAVSTNIIEELDATAAGSQLADVQATLSAISKVEATEWVDNSVIAIAGAESTVSGGQVSYKGSIKQFANGKIDASKPYASNNVKYEKFHKVDNGARAIASVSLRKPSFGQYTEAKRDYPIVPEAFNTGLINTMNLFGDARLHMYQDDDDNDINALTEEKEDVFVTVANYAMFAHLMDNNQGYFPVFFGGTWCPNTQAIVFAVDSLAKDYGISKVYFFDPRLEDGTKVDGVSGDAIVEDSAYLASSLNTRTADATGKSYNFNFLYGKFLSEYLDTYKSEWNITEGDNVTERFIKITVDGKATDFTRMCVPNMMMFNGEEDGKAELVALCEAEYTYANVSTEGHPEQVEWYAAVKAVFDENPYATYAPIIVAEEDSSADAGSAGGSAGGSTGGGAAAGGGGDAC